MDLPNRINPRLKDFDYSENQAYFITICAKDKNPFFTNDALNQLVIDCLVHEKNRTGVSIYAYCLMPNHLHLLLSPGNKGVNISSFIGGFKSKSTKIAWINGIKGKLWQERFHDHILRKREDLESIAQYILNNPVRKELALKWQDYKYCGITDSWV